MKASRELLGEHGCYPMIAYGTMQDGEAFRNVCRSHGLEFDEYNKVAKNIEHYKDTKKWASLYEESQRYVGAIISASVHPCAHVLDNKDLREEYGIVRIGNALCVMVTSSEADEYKLLKNDYLVVTVWKLISETFDMIGQPIMTIKELLSKTDEEVWSLYARGLTSTLNQLDGEWATSLIRDYKPTNLSELAQFVAAIRPSFNSWRDMFIARAEYSIGSKELDKVLESTGSYILFQETLMQYFDWLGVTPAESIGLIKKISKKKIHQEDFDALEERLKAKWIENTGSETMFAETWKMIQSCISYGFAAPHALAVAIDSLYGAYLKAKYPLEYYTVCLNNYSDDADKTSRLTEELGSFGIKILPIKFRHSSDKYSPDKETNSIYKGISSIKYMSKDNAQKLYELRHSKYDHFIDFLRDNPCNSRQTEALIRLGFFSEFGEPLLLMDVYALYNDVLKKLEAKTISQIKLLDYGVDNYEKYCKTQSANGKPLKSFQIIDVYGLAVSIEEKIRAYYSSHSGQEPLKEQIKIHKEYLGYVDIVTNNEQDRQKCFVMSIFPVKRKRDGVEFGKNIVMRSIGTGKEVKMTVDIKAFQTNPFKEDSVIEVVDFYKNKQGYWNIKNYNVIA